MLIQPFVFKCDLMNLFYVNLIVNIIVCSAIWTGFIEIDSYYKLCDQGFELESCSNCNLYSKLKKIMAQIVQYIFQKYRMAKNLFYFFIKIDLSQLLYENMFRYEEQTFVLVILVSLSLILFI